MAAPDTLPSDWEDTLPADQSQKPLKTFDLPKSAFTTFRLIYGTPKDISRLSTSVFLGSIPDVWLGGPQTGLIFGTATRARKSVKRQFKSASSTIRQSVRWFLPIQDSQFDEYADPDDPDEDFNFFTSQNRQMEKQLEDAYYEQGRSLASIDRPLFDGSAPAVDAPAADLEIGKVGLSKSIDKGLMEAARDGRTSLEISEPDEDDFIGEFVLNRNLQNLDVNSYESGESVSVDSLVTNSIESLIPFVPIPVDVNGEVHEPPYILLSPDTENSLKAEGGLRKNGKSLQSPDDAGNRENETKKSIGLEIGERISYAREPLVDGLKPQSLLPSRSQSTSPSRSPSPTVANQASRTASNTRELNADEIELLQPQDVGVRSNYQIQILGKNPNNTSRTSSISPSIPVTAVPSHSSLAPSRISTNPYLSLAKVKFDVRSTLSRKSTLSKRSKISFALPQPEQPGVSFEKQQYVRAEREHDRMLRKLHSLASRSKGRAKHTGLRLKLKVVESIMSKYKAGEIIRVDRMLVLIEKTSCRDVVVHSEGEHDDARILDRWKEYYTVLRKTKHLSLEIQLFEVSETKDFEGKPDHALPLSHKLKADFYSTADKSISVIDKKENESIKYIFNSRYVSTAFKWLFIIKEIIRDDMNSRIGVHLTGLDLQLTVNVPDEMLHASLHPSKVLNVVELEKGYYVGHGELLEFLRQELLSSLQRIRHVNNGVDQWLKTNTHPWLCFKFYDRLEWAAANSRVFFIQNRLQGSKSKLEFRQITGTPMIASPPNEEPMERPHSIEGFLARVTNISGEEVSFLRPFYRIQYFYTCDNVLLFSQIFKGTPPSPENAFMNAANDNSATRDLLPQIYYKIPFPLDEREHITWLGSPEFAQKDAEAIEEFERKVQQIVKADAMVDLNSVAEVRPVLMSTIIKHHRYFQSFLWYSSTQMIEDEDIIDCAFEIVHANGGKLKLMAPSRIIRDEWVQRLNEIVKFWKNVKLEDIAKQVMTQQFNCDRLEINEFDDSNEAHQTKVLEKKLALGNDRLFNTSSMAMATSVIQSGYLYLKHKKHSNFNQYYVLLTPGYLVVFTLYQRSKISGIWKKTPYFKHYLTILLSLCYVYSGDKTWQDLIESSDFSEPGKNDLPRIYSDGWKSSEEDSQRCFTLWFGHKRKLKKGLKEHSTFHQRMGRNAVNNPGLTTMVRKLGVTGKKMVFLARSRQERECWVYKILIEMNRFSK
ncbi:CIC11C00000004067 [Sungouiella intermedia]|uniref:CIC11C00000004067 n=1 Tax=Sungouiella intermedia TaxID=45354 RepID=A0A1L0D3X0_9ASCO|nr:CIC11C00000004067 [[Candida] intermedia]